MTIHSLKRVLVFALVLAVLSTGIAVAQDVVQLTATVVGVGPTPGAMQAVADAWNSAHPEIQVRVEAEADDATWQAAAPSTMFASDDGPDLSWWWCTRAQNWRDMSEAGMLAPLDDLYQSEGWDKAYPQGLLDYFRDPVDGHYYGVNIDVVYTPLIYYNQEAFDKLGLKPPTTWDEFYALTDALTAGGYIPLSAVYDMSIQNHLTQALQLRSWSYDEYLGFTKNWSSAAPEDALQYKWTDPNGVRIFQHIQEMGERNVWGRGFQALTDYNQSKSLFSSGSAAMFQSGIWEAGTGGLMSQVPFKWSYFFYPMLDQTPYGVVGSWPANCMIVFQNRPHVEEAKQFLAFLISPEGMAIWGKAAGTPPGRTDLSPEVMGQILNEGASMIAADIGKQGSVALWESFVTPELFQGIRQHVDLVLTGSETPEEAAAAVQQLTEEARANN